MAEYPGVENERRFPYRGTRLAPGVRRGFVPGEMEAELEVRQRREGMPLNEATVRCIRDVAVRLRVDASALW